MILAKHFANVGREDLELEVRLHSFKIKPKMPIGVVGMHCSLVMITENCKNKDIGVVGAFSPLEA